MELGTGLVYFSGFQPVLQDCADLIDVIEIEPQTFWLAGAEASDPPRVDAAALQHIAALPFRKLVHGVGFPVGGTRPPDPRQMPALDQTLSLLQPQWFSEHLSFNTARNGDREFYTAFLLPPRQTEDGVRAATDSIQTMQARLPVPLAIETGVSYLRPLPDEIPDGEFIARIVENTGAGILLDLHNIWANQKNGRQQVRDFLNDLPLDQVWELHLAGGQEHRGLWLDAHSGGIPGELFELALATAARLPNLGAVIFEMFPGYLHGAEPGLVRRQLQLLRRIWDSRGKDLRINPRARSFPLQEQTIPPVEWETVLGSLAVGVPAEGDAARLLAADPGIEAIRYVIGEFRSSVLVRTLKLTSRLLLLELGDGGFGELLRAFWAQYTPELFGSDEAKHFAAFLRAQKYSVPALEEVLAFELATLETLIDGQARTVRFPFDPMPVLRSLAEGRLPTMWKEREVEVEITPDYGLPSENAHALQMVH